MPSKNAELITFLVEDLKVTSEHLRDTDGKLSLWIQIYAGAFAVIISATITLVGNGIFSPTLVLSEGLFLFAFSLWLFRFSLRCKETKAIYLNRLNFLREGILKKLRTTGKPKIGDWTAPINIYPKTAPGKVGVDDLYPYALHWIMVIMPFMLIFLLLDSVLEIFKLGQGNGLASLLIALAVSIVIYSITKREMMEADIKAQDDINKLRRPV